MTRDLAADIHGWLTENGEATVEQIARGVVAATQTVRETLRSDQRFSGPWGAGIEGNRRKLWAARSLAADGSRRVSRPATQGEQILQMLADGRWYTTAQILRTVPCIVHSRVAELKSRGHRIEHRGAGGGAENHSYRLVTLDEETNRVASGVMVSSSSGTASDESSPFSTDGMAVPLFEQLVLS